MKASQERKRCGKSHVWNDRSKNVQEGRLCLCEKQIWLNDETDGTPGIPLTIGSEYIGPITPLVFMRRERDEKAKLLLRPYASQIEPENIEYFLVLKDSEDDEYWEEVGDCEQFCEGCVEQAVGNYQEKYADELKQQKKIVGYEPRSTDYENDGFQLCDLCGKHLDVCLYLDDQELEHWEGLQELSPTDPEIAYELTEIIENPNGHDERVNILIERVIQELHADETQDVVFPVRLLDFLSPDLYLDSWRRLKYGVERTFYAILWLYQQLLPRASYHNGTVLCQKEGVTWREQLSRGFHELLVQEYGESFSTGICTPIYRKDIVERRKDVLSFDKEMTIALPGKTMQAFQHEIDEYHISRLLSQYNGKKLNINPQGAGFAKRDSWYWQIGHVSISLSKYGVSVSYEYDGDKDPEQVNPVRSSWTNHFDQQEDETLPVFFDRVDAELERITA